jgi:hypothetical protein
MIYHYTIILRIKKLPYHLSHNHKGIVLYRIRNRIFADKYGYGKVIPLSPYVSDIHVGNTPHQTYPPHNEETLICD